MARKIVIDTYAVFFDVELWEAVGDRGVLFYQRLWGLAEQWGGFEPVAANLSAEMGALRCTKEEAVEHLAKLHSEKKIVYYQAEGKQVAFIGAYLRHNKHQHASPPTLPLPKWVTYNKDKKKYQINMDDYQKFLEDYSNIL